MSLRNSDFQKLLVSNDQKLVKELTKGVTKRKRYKKEKAPGEKPKARPRPPPREPQEPVEETSNYRDRAKERQQGDVEYQLIASEFENQKSISAEESMYLGGDLDHTHLVKGLDFALLSKVRTELSKHERREVLKQREREIALAKAKKREFLTVEGRQIHAVLFTTLHPHHRTYKERLLHMEKHVARGVKYRTNTNLFEEGRSYYSFDLTEAGPELPTIVMRAAEDIARRTTKRVHAPVSQGFLGALKSVLSDHAMQRRKKRERQAAKEAEQASGSADVHVEPRPRAKDSVLEIFDDAEKFDPAKMVAKQSVAKSEAPLRDKKRSYFDDKGKGPDSDEDDLGFEKAKAFAGAREGWVFKLGPKGLGYYQEEGPRLRKSERAKEVEEQAREIAAKRETLTRAERERAAMARIMAKEKNDAYEELFPESMLMPHNSKYKEKPTRGKKGKDDDDGGLQYGKQDSAPKRPKLTDDQKWDRIETMMNDKSYRSVDPRMATGAVAPKFM